ncbi:uncharacterized protein LOC142214433 [Leptodactylus fuscus]|uniref:uncharacterized protein LOC142214433 n=1 Tax=Leptodactylus fuscus TaxID=238119 RepID=UPI003F4F0C33
MGTRRLLISIGSLLIFLTCIQAQATGQKKISEEDWDSVDQEYTNIDLDNVNPDDVQQTDADDDDVQQTQQSDGGYKKANIITHPPPVYKSVNPYHNQRICSTFSNHHYKTFDGEIFHFRGHCSYKFVSHCHQNYEEFFVGITRQTRKNVPVIASINMKLEGLTIVLAEKSVTVNNEDVDQLPYSHGGVEISKTGTYMRVSSKIGMVMLWNEEDSITVELSQKYANQTCGLCGDYNGNPHNEFMVNNAPITNHQYGKLHKYRNPEEEMCDDSKEEEEDKTCPTNKALCRSVLTGAGLKDCNNIVKVDKYVELCEHDICRCKGNSTGFCLCNIFTEYSRQCTHAGGKPKNWRTSQICPLKCAFNLQFKECGTACPDTCTNPERSSVCDDHCTDGCFCPAGTVFDDIRKTGCIPKEQCPCTHNDNVYPSGTGYSETCQDCTCQGGKWNCVKKSCFGVCAVEGGSHITTFDLTRYNFHGDCTYTLAKTHDSSLSILAEISKCGHTDTETCLKSISISLNGGREFILVKKCGSVYINSVYTQLPVSTASVTIFKPTSFFTIIQTVKGMLIKIQLVPIMQVYVEADPQHKDKLSGLCGNFNDIQADDFKSPAGVLEGTGSSFGNLWKIQLDCPNVKNIFEDPCALIGQNEQYASHHCDLLLDSDGPFASCHKTVDAEPYHKNCMFDACSCEKKEDCMCAALSSYAYACVSKGVDLSGWRTNICHSYAKNCPNDQVYRYKTSSCQPSCRGLSEVDVTCKIETGTLDGCTCPDEMYRGDNDKCFLAAACSCYYKGTAIAPNDVIHENGAICTCTNGKLECLGVAPVVIKECDAPMVYFNCDNATEGAKGFECQKSCSSFDTECYSSSCVSGCVCPEGLVLDDERNICIPEHQCPCRLNDDYYAAGETVQVKCNTCTCKHKKWECTTNTCLGTCSVYGDGHYITFDQKRYHFNGNCWYTLVEDYTSDDPSKGTFRILTENVPCGSSGTTCSKKIRMFLGNYEMTLGDQKFDVVKKDSGNYVPFKVRHQGIYMVVEAQNGLAMIWDKKTSLFVKLDPKYEGKVSGLCGNFDGNAANDLVTRSRSMVGDIVEFGNSWKVFSRCPNAVEIKDTCASNPYRKAWSQKQCSIITSGVFVSCHGVVDPVKFYEACVNDACACDTGGDCDCFCTAVAAYAQACSEAGQCIRWRTPNICPVFCDFYNQQGHCEWHYKACGAPCLKTCMNPTGVCFNKLIGLEGCYPTCPEDRPYFDEESMRCVASCHCYDEYGDEFKPGEKMPGPTRCSQCMCQKNGRECTRAKECCEYEGKEYLPGDIVYYTADEIGGCLKAICSENSTIERSIGLCPTTSAPTTIWDFSSSSEEPPPTPTTTHEGGTSTGKPGTVPSTSEPKTTTGPGYTTSEAKPTTCVEPYDCKWSEWYDVSKPENNEGDFERFEDIKRQGHEVCEHISKVECEATDHPGTKIEKLGQVVTCNRNEGLVCRHSDNDEPCLNYKMRALCCKVRDCTTTPSSTNEEPISTPSIGTPPPTTPEQPVTLPQVITETSTSEEFTTGELTSPEPETSKTPSTTTSGSPGTPETTGTETVKTTSSEETQTSVTPSPTTTCVYKMECRWTPWYDGTKPNARSDGGDTEIIKDIKDGGHEFCTKDEVENKIECQAIDDEGNAIADNKQKYTCDKTIGLVCHNRDQLNKQKCKNYGVRMECCQKVCEKVVTPEVTTPKTTEPKPTTGETTTEGTTESEPEPSPEQPLSTPSPTTLCVLKMECRWTEWFDDNKPTTKSDGGDTESIPDIKASGREVCESKEVEDKIECRAVDKDGQVITENRQKYNCSLPHGVSCQNREQAKKEKCNNYMMRVLCCAEVCEPVSTKPETSEPVTQPGTTPKEPGTETSSPPEDTTPPSTTTSEVSTPSTSTSGTCIEKMYCRWTQWYDISKPSKKSDGGESENPKDIILAGNEICTAKEVERKIECEAVDNAGVKIANNKQTVTCTLGTGLSCQNEEQEEEQPCHNYRMRVQCCETHCEPVETLPTTSVTKPTISTPKDCDNERALECRWTDWFNQNKPSEEINGGESENTKTLKSSGIEVCKKGEVEYQIECKDEQNSETPSKQKTTCNVKDGLICRNLDQSGENCNDHSIRMECCSEKFVKSCGESTTVPTTTSGTTTPSSEKPPSPSSTEVKPPTTSCVKKMECRWTQWYDNNPANPKGNGGDFENPKDIIAKGQTICNENEVRSRIECQAISKDGTVISDNKQKFTCDVETGLSCENKNQKTKEKCDNYRIRYECCAESCENTDTTQAVTSETSESQETPTDTKSPTSGPSTPTTTSTTKTEDTSPHPATTTSCEKFRQNECRWTNWFNTGKPSSDPSGGDIENPKKLSAMGIQVCNEEEDEEAIKCRAVDHPDKKFEDLGQDSECSVENGLICLNSKQQGEIKQCLDYEFQVECCSKRFIEVCGKTTPTPTSPSTSEVTKSPTTTSTTEPSTDIPTSEQPGTKPGTPSGGTTPGQTSEQPGTQPGTPSEDTTPGQTSEQPGTQPGTPSQGTTPGQTSEQPGTKPGTPSEGTTPGQTSEQPGTQPGTPSEGTTPGQTSEQPGTQPGTPSEGITPGQTSEQPGTQPGTPSEGTTPGQTSEQPGTQPGTPSQGTTPGQTSEQPGTQPGTPSEGTTPGQTSEQPGTQPGTPSQGTTPGQTSEQPGTQPGTPSQGTTPGQTSEQPGTQPGTPSEGTTPGQTSEQPGTQPGTPSEGTTPGQTSEQPGTQPGTPSQGTTPGQTSEQPGTQPGTPSQGTTPGQTSEQPGTQPGTPSEGTTPGQTSEQPGTQPGTPSQGTTPGQTSEQPGTQPGTPSQGTTPGQTSEQPGTQPGTPSQGTTPGQTSEQPGTQPGTPSEGTTPGQTSEQPGTQPGTPSEGTTPGQTSEQPGTKPGTPSVGTTPGQTSEQPGTQPGTPSEGTTPGQTSEQPGTQPGTPSQGTTPGQTSEQPGTQPGTPSEGTTPGQTSEQPGTQPGTPSEGTTPGQTSEQPGTQPGTPSQGTTPGQTSEQPGTQPGTPSEGTTPGQTSEQPGTQPGTPSQGTTPGQTSEQPGTQPGTPSQGTTPGQTSEQPGTQPGTPSQGTTPGQTSEQPGTQPGTPSQGTTPGQTSEQPGTQPGTPSQGTTPGQTSEQPGTQPGTPSQGTTPGQTSEQPGTQPGTPSVGTTPGQTSEQPGTQPGTPSEGTTPGQTSEQPGTQPGTPSEGTTPGQTSEQPGTQPGTPSGGTTPGQTSEQPGTQPGTPSGGTTPGQTSEQPGTQPGTPSGGTTPGQTSEQPGTQPGTPSQDTTPGQTSEQPGTQPGTPSQGTTPGQTSEQPGTQPGTPSEGTTPGQTSEQPGTQPGTPSEGTTPGQTSEQPGTQPGTPSEGTTPGQTSEQPGTQPGTPSGGTTPGQTSEQPGTQPGTPSEGTTPGQTSEQPGTQPGTLSEGTTPGQTSEQPGTQPGTPSQGTTPGQTSEQPGTQPGTPSQGTTPGQTSEQPGTQPGTPSQGTTPGQTSEQPGTQPGTPSEGTTPGQTSEQPGTQPGTPSQGTTPGQTSEQPGTQPGTPSEGTTPGQTSEQPGTQPGTPSEGTTPGQTSEQPGTQPGTPSQGTTPGQTSEQPGTQPGTPSEGTTPGQTSEQPGTQPGTPSEGTTPGQTSEQPGTQPGTPSQGTTPGQTSEQPGTQPGTPSQGTTPGQTSEQPGTKPGTPSEGTTPGQTSEQPGTQPGTPSGGTTPGQTSEQPGTQPGTPSEGTTPGQTSEQPGTQPGTPSEGTTPGQTSEQPGTKPGTPTYPTSPSNCKVLRDKECRWTKWFNTDKPSSDASGEEKETLQKLQFLGTEVCKNEEVENDIECKSEGSPGSYQNSEQVVTCNVKDGLTCKNKQQADGQCLDHAIRFECCSKIFVEKCGEPEQTTPSSEPTTKCFCKVNDKVYTPGEMIYTAYDHEGCAFHAFCGDSCEIKHSVGDCPTPTPTTTTSGELTSIKDVGTSKDKMTRPPKTTKKPGTPGTTESNEWEPSTETPCGPCECLMPNCSTGYRVVSKMPPGACCATITCEPDSVCVVEDAIYMPGSTIPQAKNACQKCECAKDEKDESGFYAVKCEELSCDKTCEKGFEYAEKAGECCGECVPKQCTIKKAKVETEDSTQTGQTQQEESGESGEEGTQILIQIGDTYRPEGDKCSYYECDEEDGKPVLTKVKKVCQELDIDKCEEGSVKSDEDGCCQTCTLKTEVKVVEKPVLENCSSRKNKTLLKDGDCVLEVDLTYCGGPCMGISMYSAESQDMAHTCSCCTELEVAVKTVQLMCANGKRKVHHYKDVVKCGCSLATCEPVKASESKEIQQITTRRRRR